MAPLRGYLDLPWGQVHFRANRAGASRPLLLMLHQSPLSSRNYDRLLPMLEPHWHAVAIDTPGYGASDPPPGEWQVTDYAAMAVACADRLGHDRFALFGRATGAVFALAAALAAPARIDALVLHGMPVYTAEERQNRLDQFAPPYDVDAAGAHLPWIWNRIKGEYPWIDPELATRFVRDYLAAGPDFATAYRAIWRYDLRAAAPALAARTLLIGGTRDRIHFMDQRARALLPAAQAVMIDGATDFAAEQDPGGFAALLLGFLGRPG